MVISARADRRWFIRRRRRSARLGRWLVALATLGLPAIGSSILWTCSRLSRWLGRRTGLDHTLEDLRRDCTIVYGYSQLLERGTLDDTRRRKAIRRMVRASGHMAHLLKRASDPHPR
jgi:signal transduction histidine kinase